MTDARCRSRSSSSLSLPSTSGARTPTTWCSPGTNGGALRSQVFQRAVLTRAAKSIGLDGLHPHELRHTAASLAIASGANVKVVQQMLGRKSATMTLDLYGHLFADQLDEAMDVARVAAVAQPLPEGVVVSLAAARK